VIADRRTLIEIPRNGAKVATWWLHGIKGHTMARPKKTDAPDLSEAQDLTAGAIERLTCPPEKLQVFLRDSKAPGLRVRATPASAKNPTGVKAFVFEAKLNRQTIRRTIGDVRAWTIEAARQEANRLRVALDAGTDPREVERQQQAAKAASKAAAAVQAVTVGEVWNAYMEARRPHWGVRHHADHAKLVQAGGVPAKRGTKGKGVTVAGPLHPLMALPLRDLSAPTIEAWAAREGQDPPNIRPAGVALPQGVSDMVRRTAGIRASPAQRQPGENQKGPRSLGTGRGETGRTTKGTAIRMVCRRAPDT
jgi:hypothetical protein